jgi:predicted dehydrogenase
MPDPVNFAVIGCGSMARGSHIPNLAQSNKARLHTCVDVNQSVLTELQGKYHDIRTTRDYRVAVADPNVQAICLATTEQLRLPVIEAVAKAAKPIYVEKPLARSLAEVYEIQRVVRQAGIPFCVGHNRRCSPAMVEAQRIFRQHMEHPAPCRWRFDRNPQERPRLPDDGVAGMSVRINDDWYSWKQWVFDKEQAPHGPMLFEMTHFTDVCNWFLAAEPEEVIALSHEPFNHGVVIRYADGQLATISMSANGTFAYPKELYECFGNGGAVIIDCMLEVRTAGIADAPARKTYAMIHDRHPQIGTEGGVSGWLSKKRAACAEAAAAGDTSLVLAANPDKGHAAILDQFVDEIQGRGPVVCGVDEAVRATRVAFAAIKSTQEKRAVRLEEV